MSVAIVTGAGQGIGKVIALRYADDGFDVAINDLPRKSEALELLSAEILAKGRRSCIILADVSVWKEVEIMVTKVVAELGQLYVVRFSPYFDGRPVCGNGFWAASPGHPD